MNIIATAAKMMYMLKMLMSNADEEYAGEDEDESQDNDGDSDGEEKVMTLAMHEPDDFDDCQYGSFRK